MTNSSPQILTPDQRLRVFVSSTLEELAEERQVVKQAIQNIHLTPVMFELGARPHAPRDLYRQYLAQSHIFVAIYWDRYGWVAPEEQISGLEDEYNLSGKMPKLIYIKKSDGYREQRLSALIARIQQDDKVSFKTFEHPAELEYLIINDLALLLTERFNLTIQNKINEHEFRTFDNLPEMPNAIIGRECNITELTGMLNEQGIRLITLTGTGGIGKTRLAIETAKRLKHSYKDGAAFVPLAPVKDHALVPETICHAIGIKVSDGNEIESLKLFLQDKSFLLILDNFEQVINAAPVVERLLAASPGLKVLITSRERLQLSFEHIYIVPVLADCNDTLDQNLSPACELFLQRAKAVQPRFEINDQNRELVCRICQRLEGIPLAIELAAGQIKLFSPAQLLQKLEKSFDILRVNYRDVPDRQKNIRNTIEWSFNLLSPIEQDLLLQISLFDVGCLLENIEAMAKNYTEDILWILESLINKSLLVRQEEDNHIRFQMLESVREFALEKLKQQDKLDDYREIQAAYYYDTLQEIKFQKINQSQVLKYLEREHPNIRQTLEYLIGKKDLKRMIEISRNLWMFWWVNAHTKEGYIWMKRAWEIYQENENKFDDHIFSVLASNVGFMSFLQRDLELFDRTIIQNLDMILSQNDEELVATTTLVTGVVKTIIREYDVADKLLNRSLQGFRTLGLSTGISLALSALGHNAIYNHNQIDKAKEYYKESMLLAKQDNNEISVIICLSGFALCEVMEKNTDAKNYLRESILLSQSLHFYEALAWSIEIWALESINENKLIHAATLMAAVDHLRNTTHLPVWEDLNGIIIEAKQNIMQAMEPEVFNEAWSYGKKMTVERMILYAMADEAA
jgi:predicted ATPase